MDNSKEKCTITYPYLYIHTHTPKDTQYTYKNYLKLMSDSTF